MARRKLTPSSRKRFVGTKASGRDSGPSFSLRYEKLAGARRGERRLMVTRFPYQVIYYVRAHDIVILAIAHTKVGQVIGRAEFPRPPNGLISRGRSPSAAWAG